MKTICMCNKKGGVGKTSVAINLAYLLSNTKGADIKVLYIDNDEQGNGTDFFKGSYDKTLADLLLGKADITEIIQPTRYRNIDLISCNDDIVLAALDVQKDDEIIQQDILQQSLESIADQYDYCIIDNPPAINITVINAFVAADTAIIVTQPHIFSEAGVLKTIDYIKTLQEYNPYLQYRVLMNNSSGSQNSLSRSAALRNQSIPLMNTKIRRTIDRIDAATSTHKSIYETSPRCKFSQDLRRVVVEMLEEELL